MISNLTNLIARRDLFRELVVSELRASTAQTRLGWLWWLLDPLFMMLIYWAIVVGLFGRGRAEYEPYWVFIFFGLVTWKHFSNAAARSSTILSRKQGLIRAVPFPTMVLPLSVSISGFFFFLCGFAVLVAMSAIAPPEHHSGSFLPLIQVPALMAFQLVIVAAICVPLSCIGVLYRDLGEVLPHLLRAGFYLSPGLYGVDLIQSVARERFGPELGAAIYSIYMLNPFAVLISGYRSAMFYGEFMPIGHWGLLILMALAVTIPGYMIYQHYDRRVIKFL